MDVARLTLFKKIRVDLNEIIDEYIDTYGYTYKNNGSYMKYICKWLSNH